MAGASPVHLATLQLPDQVNWAQFSKDGRRLGFAASAANTAWLWNIGAPGLAGEPIKLKHRGPVYQVVFSPNGRFAATASGDHIARVWDADTGEPVTPT